MKYGCFLVLTVIAFSAAAQKPVIDTTTFKSWLNVGSGQISDDGQYVCYRVTNGTLQNSLVIQSRNGNWKKTFFGASSPKFAFDSKHFVFKAGKDSLCVFRLGTDSCRIISPVTNYEIPEDGQGDWFAYQQDISLNRLVLLNLNTGKNISLPGVKSYLFNRDGSDLIILVKSIDNRGQSLSILNLPTGYRKTIWSDTISNEVKFTFDRNSQNVAFVIQPKKGNPAKSQLWFYKTGTESATLLMDKTCSLNGHRLELANVQPDFNENREEIFIGLKTAENGITNSEPMQPKLHIWSYLDAKLLPVQEVNSMAQSIFKAAINIRTKKVARLEEPNELMVGQAGNYILYEHGLGNSGSNEAYWNVAAQLSFYLVNIETGERIKLKDHVINPYESPGLSPSGKWIIYYEFKKGNYFSYNTTTRRTKNITANIKTKWDDESRNYPEARLAGAAGGALWLSNDQAVLFYDRYSDIWQIDPAGVKAPINLTNGYGRRNVINFRIVKFDDPTITFLPGPSDTVILQTVNLINQNRGFYSMRLSKREDPKMLTMGPYVYGEWEGHDGQDMPPLKSRKSPYYLTLRMSATEAPNYFISDGLTDFRQISDVHPEKQWNWLTTELFRWKTLDGTYSAGILYKPENFDPKKKYPVIFDYYEKRSDELNLFIDPQPASDRINIPWFVSRGYLVFVPDIHYKIGLPGPSAYNSIVSAAVFLRAKPFVDAKRMGLQGHSFGGYETNYIVTHSTIFAAACSAAGISDLTSMYGAVAWGPFPMYWAERMQGRIGVPPWVSPELYVKNSPIYTVNKVTTPLLLMHNPEDEVVPCAQSIELFNALRRLGKRVWLLQYEGSGHSIIFDYQTRMDYTIRMTEFFDHYLKGGAAPKWMVEGMQANSTGLGSGLELERNGVEPGAGLDKNF